METVYCTLRIFGFFLALYVMLVISAFIHSFVMLVITGIAKKISDYYKLGAK